MDRNLQNHSSKQDLRRRVDDHNKRVMDIIQLEVNKIERGQPPQLKTLVVAVSIFVAVLVVLWLTGLLQL